MEQAEFLKLLLSGMTGALVGAIFARANERIKQLRELMLKEATALTGGLATAVAMLRKLQSASIDSPSNDSPFDLDRFVDVSPTVAELLHDAEQAILSGKSHAAALVILFQGPSRTNGFRVSNDLRLACENGRAAANVALPEEQRTHAASLYGHYVAAASDHLYRLLFEVQKELWQGAGPIRLRWRQKRDLRKAEQEVVKTEEELLALATLIRSERQRWSSPLRTEEGRSR